MSLENETEISQSAEQPLPAVPLWKWQDPYTEALDLGRTETGTVLTLWVNGWSGVNGVMRDGQKWRVQARLNRTDHCIFESKNLDSREEAKRVALEFAHKYLENAWSQACDALERLSHTPRTAKVKYYEMEAREVVERGQRIIQDCKTLSKPATRFVDAFPEVQASVAKLTTMLRQMIEDPVMGLIHDYGLELPDSEEEWKPSRLWIETVSKLVQQNRDLSESETAWLTIAHFRQTLIDDFCEVLNLD